MILSEQKFSNLNRIYYHGQIPNFKDGLKIFKEIYLSTSLLYSMSYAYDDFHNFGKIEEFKLKNSLNIFNTKSKTDEGNLRKYLQQYKRAILKSFREDLQWANQFT